MQAKATDWLDLVIPESDIWSLGRAVRGSGLEVQAASEEDELRHKLSWVLGSTATRLRTIAYTSRSILVRAVKVSIACGCLHVYEPLAMMKKTASFGES
ncbi:hypothetical protein Hypma_016514 [Hypsizygus marmoreus]|uniref:Uncharacterized protein n=1 Tax=Hypsizygus marmoreus TaxID=39966 RepID=A0A369J177_HYPMA|nr:hypothetical protein Hypma_016514 [Hypsizygus marmoreus]